MDLLPRISNRGSGTQTSVPEKIGQLEWYRKENLGRGINLVYKGRFLNANNLFNKVGPLECAIKRIFNHSGVRAEEREIRMLIKLCRTEIDIPLAMFYHFEEDDDFWYVAIEKFDQNLQEYLKQESNIELEVKIDLIFQAAKGLAFLHERAVVHKDIKPSNYLVRSGSGNAVCCKLTDFGFSKVVRDGSTSRCSATLQLGTQGWIAPELELRKSEFSMRCDVWSFGCVAHFIFDTCRHPFGEDAERIKNIKSGNPIAEGKEVLEAIERTNPSVLVANWVSRMISSDPLIRPNLKEILSEVATWKSVNQPSVSSRPDETGTNTDFRRRLIVTDQGFHNEEHDPIRNNHILGNRALASRQSINWSLFALGLVGLLLVLLFLQARFR